MELNTALSHSLQCETIFENLIERVAIDSRRLSDQVSNTCFIALKGTHFDGHDFLEDAYRKGVRIFLVEQNTTHHLPEDAQVIEVQNTALAFKSWAKEYRAQWSHPVVGITGSNGKTHVKEYFFQLFEEQIDIFRSPKSFNSQIGVPLSILLGNSSFQVSLIEAGISHPCEMESLENMISPDIGIFTNIGDAHGSNFENIREKIKEKSTLFKHAHTIICSAEHKEVENILNALYPEKTIIAWSWESPSDYMVRAIDTLEFRLTTPTGNLQFVARTGTHSEVENIVHALVLGDLLGLNLSLATERTKSLAPLEMRMQMMEGIYNTTIINDSYSNDTHSLAQSLQFAVSLGRPIVVLLSDFYDCHKEEENAYAKAFHTIFNYPNIQLLGIGKDWKTYGLFHEHALYFENLKACFKAIPLKELSDTTVLVKGARRFAFEHLVQLLTKTASNSFLEVKLDALEHNFRTLQSLLPENTWSMVVLKAFSYGIGAKEIAQTLLPLGVNYFAVAYAQEGIELREQGISTPILVFHHQKEDIPLMVHYGLEPSIYHRDLLLEWAKYTTEETRIHLKLETGMHRLGLLAQEDTQIIETLKSHPQLKLASVYSHLAASDSESHDAFTEKQIHEFDNRANLYLSYSPDTKRHILNSHGILRFPKHAFEMARMGIGLFGCYSRSKHYNLETVLRLSTRISQIRTVPKRSSVGYNRTHRVTSESTQVATIPIGYADGILRSLGTKKGKVWIHGVACPIIGDICMDSMMIDVSQVPCSEGDSAYFFSEEYSLEQMAKDAGTIPYEIMTGLSSRIQRIYTK